MDDLISRQAAIDAICKCTDIFVTNLPVMVDKADAYKALAELPSAQTEPPWIPCNERLPETNGNYLCTNKSGWYDINMNVWMGENWLYEDEEPLAWMPLPEPWRGGEHGQDD